MKRFQTTLILAAIICLLAVASQPIRAFCVYNETADTTIEAWVTPPGESYKPGRFYKEIRPGANGCCNWGNKDTWYGKKGCNPTGKRDAILKIRIKSRNPEFDCSLNMQAGGYAKVTKKVTKEVKRENIKIYCSTYKFDDELLSEYSYDITISYPYEIWMADMADKIGNDTLKSVILPGTHNSGTYGLRTNEYACEACRNTPSEFADQPPFIKSITMKKIKGWAQTQDESIAEQLKNGIRYFDLRFFRDTKDGPFYIHHTLRGPKSDVILDDIESFVKAPEHGKEIVILKFSHMYEGKGGMKDQSHQVFIKNLYERFKDLMIPNSVGVKPNSKGVNAKLNDIWGDDKRRRVLILYEYINDKPGEKFPPEADRALLWNCRPLDKSGQIAYLVDQECDNVGSLSDINLYNLRNIGGYGVGQRVEDLVNCKKKDKFWSLGVSISARDDIILLSGYRNLKQLARYVNSEAIPALRRVDPNRLNIITMDYHKEGGLKEGGLVPLVIELNK